MGLSQVELDESLAVAPSLISEQTSLAVELMVHSLYQELFLFVDMANKTGTNRTVKHENESKSVTAP